MVESATAPARPATTYLRINMLAVLQDLMPPGNQVVDLDLNMATGDALLTIVGLDAALGPEVRLMEGVTAKGNRTRWFEPAMLPETSYGPAPLPRKLLDLLLERQIASLKPVAKKGEHT